MSKNQIPEEKTNLTSKSKISSKQIIAIVGIVLLVLLYIVTLLVAIFDSSSSGRWFWMCLISTVAVPILVWIYSTVYTIIQEKRRDR